MDDFHLNRFLCNLEGMFANTLERFERTLEQKPRGLTSCMSCRWFASSRGPGTNLTRDVCAAFLHLGCHGEVGAPIADAVLPIGCPKHEPRPGVTEPPS